jgi:acetyl esterase
MADRGACAGRAYLERGALVTVLRGWRGKGPRNVLIERNDGSRVVRPFRGLRVPREETVQSGLTGRTAGRTV